MNTGHADDAHDDACQQHTGIAAKIIDTLSGHQGRAAETQHAAHVAHGLGQILRVEEDEAEGDDQQHIDVPDHLGPGLDIDHLLHQKQTGEHQAPEHKGPGRTVPQAREHPHEEDVSEPLGLAHPAAAQGDIQVIPEPAAQGHVPTPPELLNGAGEEGIVEILREFEAEDPAQADGHIGITGKVKVNIEKKCNGIEPVKQQALFVRFPEQFHQQPEVLTGKHEHHQQ